MAFKPGGGVEEVLYWTRYELLCTRYRNLSDLLDLDDERGRAGSLILLAGICVFEYN